MSSQGLLERIERILSHELATGCRDRAVTGGLESALGHWEGEARRASPAARAVVRRLQRELESYGHRPPEERQESLARAMTVVRRVRRPRPKPPPAPPDPDQPVGRLRGVSDAYGRRLARLGVETVRDLLYHFPRRYEDFSQIKRIADLEPGEQVTVQGRVWETSSRETRRGLSVTRTILADSSGTLEVAWFNQPYMERQLKPGREMVLSGRVDTYKGRLTLTNPEWEADGPGIHTSGLVPVYPLTQGLTPRWLRRVVRQALDGYVGALEEPLPDGLLTKYGLPELAQALQQVHFPRDWTLLKAARRRLAFEELLYLQIGVLRQKREWQAAPGVAIPLPGGWREGFEASLPFRLTGAQQRTVGEILEDLARPRPMSRLLQGDVGSGKTVVALAGLLAVVEAGYQAAFMAPTEILAEQHYRTLSRLLEGWPAGGAGGGRGPARGGAGQGRPPVGVRLLTGSLTRKEKEEVRTALEAGEVDIVVGTHALIQEGVILPRLALAVVDEQHRFGVRQRAALKERGFNPHLLVMSATPIPRTVAHTVFGDLDLSVIDELPPTRKPVETRLLGPEQRPKAYDFIRREVQRGHRAFVICPLVEESEAVEARAAIEEHQHLSREVFPDLGVELLHGRMAAEAKSQAMARFASGESPILVATPVVEVGVDVPQATVMLIESADRFGLAQLHQFRGRVGRGRARATCLLLAESAGEEALERLRLVASTSDGFQLAAYDLQTRGPGHLFGTYQTGRWELKMARLADLESRTLDRIRREARALLEADPQLAGRPPLARAVERFWQGRHFGESEKLAG